MEFLLTLLALFQADPAKYFRNIMTQNKTWVHFTGYESKELSLQYPGFQPPNRVKQLASVGKVMTSGLLDLKGVVMNYDLCISITTTE